jgi:ligand-binding SRPBCC domain-containing protein
MPLDRVLDRLAWAPAAGGRPDHGLVHLHAETVVAAPLDETFAFFSNPANLERLTPSWLAFRIRTPLPPEMHQGLEIDYRIVLYGWPIPWRTRIEAWEPGVRFVDRQIVGPYRWWHHEHRFVPEMDGTRVIDHVEYRPRLAWLTGGFVRRDVERIFAYRHETLQQIFGR